MSEQEAVAYIEEWDVTEAAKVLKWYEEYELLRPCDCDTIVAIETENLRAENAKLRELVIDLHLTADEFSEKYERPFYADKFLFRRNHINDRMRELGIEVPHEHD